MDDIKNLIGALFMIATMVFMYVFVVRLINEPSCAALADGYLVPVIRELTQAISLCWW